MTGPAPRTAELQGGGGVRLHLRAWEAPAPRAALLVCHGIGEHSGRYEPLAAALAGYAISSYAVDLRGNGLSGGRQGYVARFAELVDDLETARLELAASLPPGLPLFLLGHSLGGLVALRHLQAHPDAFRGAVLSAPALGIAVPAPLWKVALAGLLSRLAPALQLANEIDPAGLTRDAAAVRAYRADPLVHDRITPRLYTEMRAAMREVRADRDRLRVPLLFIVPGQDRIVRPEAVLAFARALPGEVTVREYPGLYHESFNEPEREAVIRETAEWLLRHVG